MKKIFITFLITIIYFSSYAQEKLTFESATYFHNISASEVPRFIEGEDNKDIFVHASNLIDQIKDGDKVSYDLEETEKGPSATNVKIQE